MCVMSMVHDHFQDPFKQFDQFIPKPGGIGSFPYAIPPTPGAADLENMSKLVREFKEAVAAAEKLDVLLKQRDCVDPEKVQLQGRVKFLEALVERLTTK